MSQSPKTEKHKRKRSAAEPQSQATQTDDDNGLMSSPKPSAKKVSFAESSEDTPTSTKTPSPQKEKQRHSFMEYSSQPVIRIREQEDRLSPGPASQPLPSSDDDGRIFDASFNQLVDKLWRAIAPRIEEIASDERHCRKEFHPFFTRNSSAPATRQTVRKLIRHPLQFSMEDLAKLFNLRRVTEDTIPQINTAAVYYLRTFPITKAQLNVIIAGWELSDFRFDTFDN